MTSVKLMKLDAGLEMDMAIAKIVNVEPNIIWGLRDKVDGGWYDIIGTKGEATAALEKYTWLHKDKVEVAPFVTYPHYSDKVELALEAMSMLIHRYQIFELAHGDKHWKARMGDFDKVKWAVADTIALAVCRVICAVMADE
jgi:hypothetical protein